jgi:hypothetical protein
MAQTDLFGSALTKRVKVNTQTRKWVVIHNDVVLARVDWDMAMIRIFTMLVSQLGRDDEKFRMQQIRVRDLMALAQISRKDIHADVADAAQRLVRQPFEFRTEDHHYEGTPIFATCKYIRGAGLIEAKFNEHARPYLLKLSKCFTKYRLRCVMSLSTPYAVRFYQIAKMIERKRAPQTRSMEIDLFRQIFLIEDKYHRYSDVVRYIIDPSVEEVNEKTDTALQCKTIRQGGSKYGKPIAIEWTVRPAIHTGKASASRPAAALQSPRPSSRPIGLPTAFETWFDNLPETERERLWKRACDLTLAEGRNPESKGFEAFVWMKLPQLRND